MRKRLRQHFWSADGDPGPFAWLLAAISIVLPIFGLILCLIGGARIMQDQEHGWLMLAVGATAIALDIVIDFVWAHPGVSESDEPELNRRGAQLAGRLARVAEPIANGTGRIRVGDTVWTAEGPDCPRGTTVRIVSTRANTLIVELVTDRDAPPSAR
jgi:membrane protein implicated in regulation of membrane protease activity